jgi:pimeloyl-ACP methyl ester carboxylesterase
VLELLALPAGERAAARAPLIFVHGAYVGAWCWAEHFLPWFAGRGHPVCALSLRGHGASAGRERLHEFGLADFADDLGSALEGYERPPVLVGHSMGALVVQKYLERNPGAAQAAALFCPVPPFGILPSSFALALTHPGLYAEINALAFGGRASRAALQQALFAGPVEAERLERYFTRMQPESRRAILDMSGWGLPQTWRTTLPDTVVIGAERDVLISPALAQSTAQLLGADYRTLPGLGHAVMLEPGWRLAAEALADWLDARGA